MYTDNRLSQNNKNVSRNNKIIVNLLQMQRKLQSPHCPNHQNRKSDTKDGVYILQSDNILL